MKVESHIEVLEWRKGGWCGVSVEFEGDGGGVVGETHKVTISRERCQICEPEKGQKRVVVAKLHIQKIARATGVDSCVQGLYNLTGQRSACNSTDRVRGVVG